MRRARRVALISWLAAFMALTASVADAPECTRNLRPVEFPVRLSEPFRFIAGSGVIEAGGAPGTDAVVVAETSNQHRSLMRVDFSQAEGVQLVHLLDFEPGSTWRYLFGDVDGDGIDDVLDQRFSVVHLYRGVGEGVFAEAEYQLLDPYIGPRPWPVLADVDGDGAKELITATHSAGGVGVWNYDASAGWLLSTHPREIYRTPVVYVGDFDGDEIDDVTFWVGQRAILLLGSRSAPLEREVVAQIEPGMIPRIAIDVEGDGRSELLYRDLLDGTTWSRRDWVFDGATARLVERWRQQLPLEVGFVQSTDLDGDAYVDLAFSTSYLNPERFGFLFAEVDDDGLELGQRTDFEWDFIAARDVDGDGLRDALIFEEGLGVALLKGLGEGRFEQGLIMTPGDGEASRVLSADMNADGYSDLLSVNFNPPQYRVRLGRGDATFEALDPVPLLGVSRPHLADFDGDSNVDLLTVSTYPEYSINLARGRGDGTFQSPTSAPVGGIIADLVLGDIDGTGSPDIVTRIRQDVGENRFYELQTFRFRNGQFIPGSVVELSETFRGLTAGDVDGDGMADAVDFRARSVDSEGQSEFGLRWWRSRGDGTLEAARWFSPESFTGFPAVRVADLDRDGLADVLVEWEEERDDFRLMVLQGDGGKGKARATWAGRRLHAEFAERLEDMNGDGFLDLVQQGDGFRIRLGTGHAAFADPGERWLGGFSRSFPRSVHGDVDADGGRDILSFKKPFSQPSFVWNRLKSEVAFADQRPPDVELAPIPEFDFGQPTPAWTGNWRVHGRALDDCGEARIASVTWQLDALEEAPDVIYVEDEIEEVRLYAGPNERQSVVLRGPDEAAIRARFDESRQGLVIPAYASVFLRENEEQGPSAAANEEPPAVSQEARLTQSVLFGPERPTRIETFTPSRGIEFIVVGVDWQGESASVRETFGAARDRYCRGDSAAATVTCE